MMVMAGACQVYDEGNTNVQRTVGELLNEGDLEMRILKTGILMKDVKRSTQCDEYDSEAETCQECRHRNRWRRDILESAIRIDLKLSRAISKLDAIVDGIHED
jgi:hypothetical protein